MRLGYKRVVYPAPPLHPLLTLVMGHAALEIFVCPTENTLEKNTKKAAQREEDGGGAGAQRKPSTGLIIYA